ncbi:MAG: hypothetical protein ACOYXC_12575 [Candidatus Rifleibacteriota bacterium]
MNIQFPVDQGWSRLEKLNQLFEKGTDKAAATGELPAKPRLERDTFEKSAPTATEAPTNATLPANGEFNISFQFNLFYELSSKVEARMGQSGAERFAELSGSVAETFAGSFDLKIDGVGSFFKNTDSALNVSPETTNEFFDAVEGLADLSPEALENFLGETEDFFNELEKTYGEAGGAFDQIKDQMQKQATAFFADVENARELALNGFEAPAEDAVAAEEGAAALPAAESGEAAAEKEDSSKPGMIKLVFKPDLLIPQDNYQDFLKKFIDYTEKFRQQMFESLFNRKNAAKETESQPSQELNQLFKVAETA